MSVARRQSGLVVLLLGLACLAWWWSAEQMEGMYTGPWADLRDLGWFLGIWVVMMAAMMLPAAIPTVTLYGGLARDRTRLSPLLFVGGYLAVWAAAGLGAFALATAASSLANGSLDWDRAGRWIAGATLLVAAAYQLTPLKDACLARCRSPLGFVLGSWRPGRSGGLRMGVAHGAWCVGCCWALMASLFALGVMSIAWTAVVAAVVTVEKILPWRRLALTATTAFLAGVGLLLIGAPSSIPGLTLPGAGPMPTGG